MKCSVRQLPSFLFHTRPYIVVGIPLQDSEIWMRTFILRAGACGGCISYLFIFFLHNSFLSLANWREFVNGNEIFSACMLLQHMRKNVMFLILCDWIEMWFFPLCTWHSQSEEDMKNSHTKRRWLVGRMRTFFSSEILTRCMTLAEWNRKVVFFLVCFYALLSEIYVSYTKSYKLQNSNEYKRADDDDGGMKKCKWKRK